MKHICMTWHFVTEERTLGVITSAKFVAERLAAVSSAEGGHIFNPLQPNDPYIGCRVMGLILEQRRVCIGQLWPLLWGPVGILSLGFAYFFYKVCMKKIKSCNINPEFCRLHRELNSGCKGHDGEVVSLVMWSLISTGKSSFHDKTDALVVAGPVWKCSGIAVQLNVNCFLLKVKVKLCMSTPRRHVGGTDV